MNNVEQLRKSTDVNLAQLEADITAVRSGSSLASITLPDYVEHQEGVSRAGALSAEAVVRDYEAAAKEIEAMGAELIGAAKKCEAMTAEVHNAIAYMRETATAYREEAKKIFKRIEDCALFTQDVRKTCEDVKRRMMEDNATD
jgi:L-rhamnose isomerase